MAVDPNDLYNIFNGTDYIQCPLTEGDAVECNASDGLNDQIFHVGDDPEDTKLDCRFVDGGTKYYIMAVGQDDGDVTSTSDETKASKFKIHGDGAIQLKGTSGTDDYYLNQSGNVVKVKKTTKQTWTWNKTKLGSSGHA